MRCSWKPWAALMVVALGLATAAQLRAACPSLKLARQAYQDLDYDRVTPLLEQALGEDCSDEDRAGVYELLAVMHVTYNRDQDAVEAFTRLLEIRPDFSLSPDRSPKLLLALEQAQRARTDPASAPPAVETAATSIAPLAEPSVPTDGSARGEASPSTEAVEDTRRAEVNEPQEDMGSWWVWAGIGTAVTATALAGAGIVTWILLQPSGSDVDFGPYPL
ncbi:MAG: hypothetical protein ABIJ09_21155 [Pseudomonadota bacterium]